MKNLNVAIIGWGPIAKFCHYKVIRKNKNLNLIAICDRNKNKLEKIKNKKILKYIDYKKMIKDNKLDLIFLCCSLRNAFNLSKYIINRKINLFSEKPSSISLKESIILNNLSKKKKIKFILGFMKIFDPAVTKLKEKLDIQEIKKIEYYSYAGKAFKEKFKSKKNKFNFVNSINKKIKYKKKYLKFIFTHSHAICLLHYLLGKINLQRIFNIKNSIYLKKKNINICIKYDYIFSDKWNEKLIIYTNKDNKIIDFASPNIKGANSKFYCIKNNKKIINYSLKKKWSFEIQIDQLIKHINLNKVNFNIQSNALRYFGIMEKYFLNLK